MENKLEGQSIQTATLLNSASKIQLQQFILLRILWPTSKQAHQLGSATERCRWISNDNLEVAKAFLSGLPAWKAYVGSLGKSGRELRENGFSGLDTFTLARLYQLRTSELITSSKDVSMPKVDFSPVAKRTRSQTGRAQNPSAHVGSARPVTPATPTPAPRRVPGPDHHPQDQALGLDLDPASGSTDQDDGNLEALGIEALTLAESMDESVHWMSPLSPFTGDFSRDEKVISDEQIVNMALLAWLDSLTIHLASLKTEWSPERLAFVVKDNRQLKVYEARVDGYLRHRDHSHDVLAIIEVKPFARFMSRDAIRMQEGAQMAAWISQQPPPQSELDKAHTVPGHEFRYGVLPSLCRVLLTLPLMG